MPDPFSRRKPWPWDARLRTGDPPDEQDVGLVIADELVAKNVQSMGQAVPNSQEYGSSDLYRERSAAFRGPLLGFGEGSQRTQSLSRYHFGINAWVSGLWRGKGPLCHVQTPAVAAGTGGPVLGFIGGRHTGSPTVDGAAFALDGRYVLRRTDDSAAGWVTSRDGGAGFVHESAARFWHAGAGAADHLYVAGRTSDTDALGELWRYDGGTWTKAEVPARFLVRLDDRLIRAWGNLTSQCSGDPMVPANWTGGIQLGDGHDVVSGMSAVQGVLYLFTRTGRVFTLNADGTANDLFPGLVKAPELDHLDAPGGQATPWLDAIWFRSRDAFFRLTGSGGGAVIEEVGPGRLVDNGSPVQGRVACFAGHQQWFGFQGVYNNATGDSYLLQYGDWYPQEGGQDPAFTFVDALHGAVVAWPNKRITALQTTDLLGPNPRLYCGFADGTIEWFDLPRTGPNPFAADAHCEFTEQPSYIVWPLHTLLASADRKEYTEASVYGPRITPGDSVQVYYTFDPTLLPTGAAPLLRTSASGRIVAGQRLPMTRALTAPGDAVEFPEDSYAYGIVLEEHYLSDTTGSIESYGTPVVSVLVLRERLHPKFRLEYQFTTLAGNRIARRDGVREARSADQLLTHLTRAASDPQTVVLQLPYETTGGFSFIGWQQTLPTSSKRYGTETLVAVDMLAFRTEALFGTIDRLGDLTIDGLAGRTIDDLGLL